jgi:hypothetical protein
MSPILRDPPGDLSATISSVWRRVHTMSVACVRRALTLASLRRSRPAAYGTMGRAETQTKHE